MINADALPAGQRDALVVYTTGLDSLLLINVGMMLLLGRTRP
jgi:hypothetical protein